MLKRRELDKMKIKRKCISIILITALVFGLAGCGNTASDDKLSKTETGSDKKSGDGKEDTDNASSDNESSGNGSGRFMETELSMPDGVDNLFHVQKLTDGSIQAVGYNSSDCKYFILKSKDNGVSWEQTEITDLKQDSYNKAVVSSSGEVALIPYADKNQVAIAIVGADGKAKETVIKLPNWSSDTTDIGNQIKQAEYDGAGNLLLLDMNNKILKTDIAGKSCSEICNTNGVGIEYFGIAGKTIITVSNDGIMLFDSTSGEALPDQDVLSKVIKDDNGLTEINTDSGYPMVFSSGVDEGSIVFANKGGVYHYTNGGTVTEQLIDGKLNSLGTISVFYSMFMTDANHIFVTAYTKDKVKLLCYTYDENVSALPNTELTIYSLEESQVLRQAVTTFQKKNPDIYVNVQIGMSGDDSVTAEDALSTLSTDIMAGKGPDVLILDGMPVDKYIEKGVLEDLSDIVSEVDGTDGLFKNIVEGSKKDGHIYGMPAKFLVPVVEGDSATLTAGGTLKTLADKCEELKKADPKNAAFLYVPIKQLLSELFDVTSGTITKEDGTLDEAVLRDYLTQVKRLRDVEGEDKERDSEEAENQDDNAIKKAGIKLATHSNTGLMMGNEKLSFGTINSMYGVQVMISAQKQTKTDIAVLNGQNVKTYIPYMIAGVVAKDNTETAKSFVKELIGKDSAVDDNGFAVNIQAFNKNCEFVLSDESAEYVDGMSSKDGDECITLQHVKLTQDNVDKFTTMLNSLTTPCLNNRVISNLILEQAEKYVTGEQELDATVNTILQKVNLYLSE